MSLKYDEVRITSLPSDPDKFLEGLLEQLETVRAIPGATHLAMDIYYERGYDDDVSAYIEIRFQRPHTEKELVQEAHEAKVREQYQRQQYKELKKKFEGK